MGEMVLFLFLYRPNVLWIFFFALSVISMWAILPSSPQSISLLICWINRGEKEWWCVLAISYIWSTVGAGFSISWCDHLPLVFSGSLLWLPLFSTEALQEDGGIALCSCAAWHENGNRSFFLLLNGSDVQCTEVYYPPLLQFLVNIF